MKHFPVRILTSKEVKKLSKKYGIAGITGIENMGVKMITDAVGEIWQIKDDVAEKRIR